MPTKITYDSLASAEDLKRLNLDLQNIGKNIAGIRDAVKGIKEADAKGVKTLQEQTKKLADEETKLIDKQKQAKAAAESLDKQRQKAYGVLAKQEAKERELRNAMNMQIKSIDDLAKKNSALVAARKRVDLTTTNGIKLYKQYTKEIRANEAQLKRHDAAIGRHQRNVGNYPKLLGGATNMLRAFGVGLGMFGAANVIRKAVGIMSDFEAALSRLKSIAAPTAQQMQLLENAALRLGATTPRTATEVANLQTEFAKLGFSTKEILQATPAALNLSIATGKGLADTASIVGSTVRGFHLATSETQRVVDVMAKGFATSALDIENFSEAVKYVAPVAEAAGFSIEETTAHLAKLADAGIRGSMAGTGLRRIYLEVAKTGKGAKEGFDGLARSGISLAEANDEVGDRAQTALLVLSKQKDEVAKLNETYKDVTGTVEEMARVMNDNLKGDLTTLSSAWEGLIQTFREGNNIFRSTIKLTSNLVTAITKSRSAIQLYAKATGDSFGAFTLKFMPFSGILEEAAGELHTMQQEIQEVTEQMDIGKMMQYVSKLYDIINATDQSNKMGKNRVLIAKYLLEELNASIDMVRLETKTIKENTDATTENNDEKSKQSGIIGKLKDQIKEQNELLDLAKSEEEIYLINQKTKLLEDMLGVYQKLGQEPGVKMDVLDTGGDISAEAAIERTEWMFAEMQRIRGKYDMKAIERAEQAEMTQAYTDFLESRIESYEEYQKRISEIQAFYAEEQLEKQRSENEQIKEALMEFVNAIGDMLAEINKAQQAKVEEEIKRRDKAIDKLQKLYDKELEDQENKDANSVKSLEERIVAEETLRDQSVNKQRELQKQEAQIGLLQQASSITTAVAKAIEGFSSIPIVGVILGLAAAATIITSFAAYKAKVSSFAEGSEFVERGNNPRGKDTIPAMVDEGERIIPTSVNRKIPRHIKNKDIPILVNRALDTGWFSDRKLVSLNSSHMSNDEMVQWLQVTANETRELKELIKNKPDRISHNGKIYVYRGLSTDIYNT